MSTVLITVQIPFYHFCTVCCTGDLVLLLDDKKGSILFSASWLFHGARSPGCPKRKTCGNGGPCSGPRCRLPSTTPGRGGAEAPLEAVQSAVNSQGSCFLSWCHLPVSVRRAVGQSPQPPFPPCLPLLAVVSKQESSLSQSVPLPQVPHAGHCTRAPAPTPVGSQPRSRPLLCPVVLLHLPGLRLHSSVTGFRIPWVCLLFSLQMSHSLLSPKSATSSSSCYQCLALVWKSLYCKETYLRLLIAVWFGVFLQTPFVPWGQ